MKKTNIINGSIGTRLFLILLVPFISLGLIISFYFIDKINTIQELSHLKSSLKVVKLQSNLIHSLQIERGLSIGYISSKKVKFKSYLIEQRKITDRLFQNIDLSKKFNKKDIDKIRQDINISKLSAQEVLKEYTSIINKLMQLLTSMPKILKFNYISQNIISIIYLEYAKENAGIQRAIGSRILTLKSNQNKLQSLIKFNTYKIKFRSQMELFKKSIKNNDYKSLLKHYNEKFKIFDKYETMIINKLYYNKNILNLTSNIWFDIATQRIDELNSIENTILNNIALKIDNLYNNTQKKLLIEVILLLIISIVVFILFFIMINTILYKLKLLQDGLVSYFDYITGKSKRYKPIKLYGDNEISNIAKVLNKSIKTTTIFIQNEVKIARYKEKELQNSLKLASMGEMIGNIAHQWRQPLSVISTAASGMQIQKEYDLLTDELFEASCDAIDKNAQYLSKTIDDFKNFIKGDRAKKVFNLKNSIEKFLSLIDGSMKNHNINIILNLKEDIELDGYENELIQCLINIFNNAKDILVEKVIKDRFVFISTKQENDKVIITIKDNAGGIPADILPKIFDPYFTTKHQSQGTGLGLHMTYNLIVDGMGGNIEANNIEYKHNKIVYTGAEFSIKIDN